MDFSAGPRPRASVTANQGVERGTLVDSRCVVVEKGRRYYKALHRSASIFSLHFCLQWQDFLIGESPIYFEGMGMSIRTYSLHTLLTLPLVQLITFSYHDAKTHIDENALRRGRRYADHKDQCIGRNNLFRKDNMTSRYAVSRR